MKLKTLAVLVTIYSIPVFAQSLPDEINSAPYLERSYALGSQINSTNVNLSMLQSNLRTVFENISKSEQSIATKKRSIQEYESSISDHRNMIPQLQREIQTNKYEISQLQSEISRISDEMQRLNSSKNYLENQIRPLESSVQIRRNQIRESETELSQATYLEEQARQRVATLERDIRQIDDQISQERSAQVSMRQDLRQFETKIAQLQSNIQSEQGSLSTHENNLRMEEAKLSSLSDRVNEYQNELSRLRQQSAPEDQIQAAERKLNASTAKRNEVAQGINSFRNEVSSSQSRISRLQQEIESERRNQSSLPGRISNSENSERELTNRKQMKHQELNGANSEQISNERRAVAKREQIRQAQMNLRGDEENLQRLKSDISQLSRQINEQDNLYRVRDNRISSLTQKNSELSNEERRRTSAIPTLEGQIRSARTQVAQSESELQSHLSERSSVEREIAATESKLASLRSQQNTANSNYEVRQDLYNRYLGEAQALGNSQIKDADKLGQQLGQQLSKTKSVSIGQPMGKELGTAQGKYWAVVRGEIEGYPKGYKLGVISQEDIQRGIKEGQTKGIEAAYAFTDNNLKPKFFDSFYLEELKKPVVSAIAKAMKKVMLQKEITLVAAGIAPLTPEELTASNEIQSTLDESIKTSQNEVKVLSSKYRSLNNSQTVFETPATIPFASIQCGQVYKSLQVFKDACLASYKREFKTIYVSSALESFAQDYPSLYEAEVQKTQQVQQTSLFSIHFSPSFKTAERDGLAQGKIDIYDDHFTKNYKLSYEAEIPAATEKAKSDAKTELGQWVTQNATITLEGHAISKQVLRGGEEAKLLVDLKNLSPQELKSTVLLKIVSQQNAQLERTEHVVTKMPGSKVTRFEEISFRTPETARSGDVISFKVEAVIPGHKYKSQRVETFKIEQALAANPKIDANAHYEKSPKIRNVLLRTKTHVLTYKLSPVIEDINEGYEVMMEVLEGQNLISLKNSTKATGKLKHNESKTISYSYTFPKQAKEKKIVMRITVKYLGEVIQVTPVELLPRG